MATSAPLPGRAPHIPVLLGPILVAAAPVHGAWLDGTFGAGGYAQGLLDAGAARVIGIDRDPRAHALAAAMRTRYGERLALRLDTFSNLADHADVPLDGVVLDLGVSSMQIDEAARGFSFQKDGPLDMRMSDDGQTAADMVNTAPEDTLADVIFHYGEDRAARRIARAIVAARDKAPITTTLQLAEIVASVLPRPKPGQSHPATRSFQAIRIAVNAEFSELVQGLAGAEAALSPGGLLAVVTFHSLEDRIVKRFFQIASGAEPAANRYAPERTPANPRFTLVNKGATTADAAELAANPRARSAKLRMARRTAVPPQAPDPVALGVPHLPEHRPQKGRR